MNDNQSSPKSSVPRRVSWLTIVLALLAIGTFIAISNPGGQYGYPMGGREVSEYRGGSGVVPPSSVGGAPMKDTAAYYPYPNPEVPATDTREFLKVYYGASMLTRDVPGVTRRVATTVRGHAGRIDQETSSSQYGYVSFVVPQSKYDAFRTELEDLVGSRFLSVSISSQNLLSQKLSIEEQQEQADTALADYTAERQNIVSAHTAVVRSLQSRIDADAQQLVLLRAQSQTPEIRTQIQTVSDEWTSLKQQLANENSSYSVRLSNADANIKYAQERQKAVQTQDQALLDNVATVTGTVSVQWISLWDIAQLYLPGYWMPAIFAALALLSFLRDRRRWAFATR